MMVYKIEFYAYLLKIQKYFFLHFDFRSPLPLLTNLRFVDVQRGLLLGNPGHYHQTYETTMTTRRYVPDFGSVLKVSDVDPH